MFMFYSFTNLLTTNPLSVFTLIKYTPFGKPDTLIFNSELTVDN